MDLTGYKIVMLIIGSCGIAALYLLPVINELNKKDVKNDVLHIIREFDLYGPNTLRLKYTQLGKFLFSPEILFVTPLMIFIITAFIVIITNGPTHWLIRPILPEPGKWAVHGDVRIFFIVLTALQILVCLFRLFIPWSGHFIVFLRAYFKLNSLGDQGQRHQH